METDRETLRIASVNANSSLVHLCFKYETLIPAYVNVQMDLKDARAGKSGILSCVSASTMASQFHQTSIVVTKEDGTQNRSLASAILNLSRKSAAPETPISISLLRFAVATAQANHL